MKKLLFIASLIFFSLAANAQGTQTEDEVYIGKGKIFGNFKGIAIIIPDVDKGIKPTNGSTSITGMVTGVVVGREGDTLTGKQRGLYSFTLQQNDGTIVTVGTKDYGFSVPKNLIGRKITVEGIDQFSGRKRRTAQEQQTIQFAATGIKVID